MMSRSRITSAIAAAIVIQLALFAPGSFVLARSPPAAPSAQNEEARRAEANAAWEAGDKAGTKGPADIVLIDQAVLKLPQDYFFIPKAEGARIMRALGNVIQEQSFVGL